ncbi:MAG: tRNA guanosine(34) transglycosylase Tgt [Planctomycetota bacterium]|nr:tRNA guanosine(34) transglycosylase Tgt [Planctomycetota bacterium]
MPEVTSWQRLSPPCGEGGPRVGRLTTPHGAVETPAFIPVGTKATVKGVRPETLREIGVEMVLANTYHLALRPGAETVRQLGGLHAVMGWDGPILTDSGGFQVFSLAGLRQVTQDGVTFRNHIDGAEMTLTPETVVAVQNELGADIIMALDVCPPYPCPRPDVEEAVRLTIDWAARSRAAHRRADQALWGIIQGGVERDLRQRCAAELVAMDFPGYAIGGVSVGEGHDRLREVLGWTAPLLPADRPRYLMGVGEPRDVVAAVAAGVDLFDCVLPTRNGRNACAFTFEGMIRLRNEVFKTDRRPIEEDCDCPACRRFSRGVLRHLFAAGEMLGPILLSIHNLRFFMRFFGRMRQAVREGRFEPAAQALLDRYYRNG